MFFFGSLWYFFVLRVSKSVRWYPRPFWDFLCSPIVIPIVFHLSQMTFLKYIHENFLFQLFISQAMDSLEIIRVTKWENLSFSSGRQEMDAQCTNKLTQEECQIRIRLCCTGRTLKIYRLLFSSGSKMSGWSNKKGILPWRRAWKQILSFHQPSAGCSLTSRQESLKKTQAWPGTPHRHHLPAAWHWPWEDLPKRLKATVRGSTRAWAWPAWGER